MKTGVLVALAALSLVGVGVVSAATLTTPAHPAYSGGTDGGMNGGYGGGMMGGVYGGGMMGGGGCGCQNYQYCQQYMYDHNYTWDHNYGMMP